jgi:hypothetical protein
MKTLSFKTLAVAAGLTTLTAVSAWADSLDYTYPPIPISLEAAKTREEVRAEFFKMVQEYHRDTDGTFAGAKNPAPENTLSRDVVAADAIEWLRVNRYDTAMGGGQ